MHNSPILISGKSMFITLFKTKTHLHKNVKVVFIIIILTFYYLLVDCELLVLEEELPERELLPEEPERELEPERVL